MQGQPSAKGENVFSPGQPLNLSLKRSFANRLFPRYSSFLDRLNWNARWVRTVRENSQCPRFDTREEMYAHLNRTFFDDGKSAIDYLEFGVFEGRSQRTWSQLNTSPETRFFGFDSFEGLPEDWSAEKPMPKGSFATSGKTPDISDPRVRFVVGWFQQSLPAFIKSYEPKNPALIHIDSDLYSSSLFCLTSLNHLMPSGTIIIFDEFYDVLHEYRALNDYAGAYMRKYRIVAATKGFNKATIELL
jgi:O-methyltransferase